MSDPIEFLSVGDMQFHHPPWEDLLASTTDKSIWTLHALLLSLVEDHVLFAGEGTPRRLRSTFPSSDIALISSQVPAVMDPIRRILLTIFNCHWFHSIERFDN
jgi:hypothetical protein